VLAATRAQGAQIGFMNNGGIRKDLDTSDAALTTNFGHAQAVLPFGNTLVVLDLSGLQLRRLLEQQWQRPSASSATILQVSQALSYTWDETRWVWGEGYGRQENPEFHVVAIDYGLKRNILRCLASAGCRVSVVTATTSAEDILARKPEGGFLSEGTGDPAATGKYALTQSQELWSCGPPGFSGGKMSPPGAQSPPGISCSPRRGWGDRHRNRHQVAARRLHLDARHARADYGCAVTDEKNALRPAARSDADHAGVDRAGGGDGASVGAGEIDQRADRDSQGAARKNHFLQCGRGCHQPHGDRALYEYGTNKNDPCTVQGRRAVVSGVDRR